MSEMNKTLVRRIVEECINKGNFAVLDELIGSNYVYHEPTVGERRGVQGYKQMLTMYRNAFPDVQMTIDEQITEGDKVVTRWTARGTHRGELFGIKPSGKHCTVQGIIVSRIVGGKLVEEHECYDAYGMLQQIGAVPTVTKAAA